MTTLLSSRHPALKLLAIGAGLFAVGFALLALGDHDVTAFANRTDS